MDSNTKFDPLFVLLFLVLLAETNTALGCIKKERDALLAFKQDLRDPSNCLSSWNGQNCCNWLGVSCSNQTGHVVKLDLHSEFFCTELKKGNKTTFSCTRLHLGGKLNPSLLELKYLSYLDLKENDFQGIPIPHFVGSLSNLRYLDLSGSSFSGMIPPNLGNLSRLRYLDLNRVFSQETLWVSDLYWLPKLSSLQYLNLGTVNLSKATTHWLQTVNMLPSLLELHLTLCELHSFPQSPPSINFSSLSVLDLSFNYFNSSSSIILKWLYNITTLTELRVQSSGLRGPIPEVAKGYLCNLHTFDLSSNSYIIGEVKGLIDALSTCSNATLEVLDLSANQLAGNLPNSLGCLKHLTNLHLQSNSISGPIPTSLGNLSLLKELDLRFNVMNGTIPESIGQLAELWGLDLFSNSWEGIVTEVHFINLTNLIWLSLSAKNSLVFKVPNDWIPPFDLYTIHISGCQLGPAFPAWLRTQTKLTTITLANSGISDTVPNWFWKLFFPQMEELDLSGNNLKGDFSSLLYTGSALWWVDLSFNQFEGSVPLWPNVTYLYLKNNKLSGPIPLEMGQEMLNLKALDLSGNFLNGSIPASIAKPTSLGTLDLSNNSLSGEIHNHWEGMKKLWVINLSRNNLSGGIPISMGSLPSLLWLKLSGNYLSGELSLSLQNCTGRLATLDIGENRFSGTIPNWIGKRFSSMAELRLRGNFLTGNIPQELCQLTYVHVLDLAHNNFSGTLPTCLDRLIGFQNQGLYLKLPPTEHQPHPRYVDLVLKGRQDQYPDDQISLVKMIDFSRNNLSGNIPAGVTTLSKLGTLNLSWNQLTGNIPDSIGDFKDLETLDLSCNHLQGPIPPSMTSLTLLSHLNLSNNNLSGPIPLANQFQTFNDPSIYEGNPGLCGSPLPTMCSDSVLVDGGTRTTDDAAQDKSDKFWFYVSMVLGFIVGFWAVCGSLAINKSWRHSYFRFLDHVKDKFLFVIAMNVARLRRVGKLEDK